MNSRDETILKFLKALSVDTVEEVEYISKDELEGHCVCGQQIKYRYEFRNKRTRLTCFVGKNCLPYITDYLGWKSKF